MAKRRGKRWIRLLFDILCVLVSLSLLLSYLSPYTHPESFTIIPVFGLAYPVIVIVFSIAMLLQFFVRRWFALGMLVFLLLGSGLHLRTFTLGSGDTPPKNSNSLKIMSYNVRLFDFYNDDPKKAQQSRNEILQFLQNEAPDIVCFQEFYQQDKPTDFVTKDTIIPLLGMKYYQERYTHVERGRRNYGIALFSKYPIIEKGEVRFDSDLNSFNYSIYSDIVFKKDTIRVYNIHLQSISLDAKERAALINEDSGTGFFTAMGKVMEAFPERAKQANRLTKHIKNSPYPVVVCGDFNDTPLSYTYQRFHNHLTDAFRNCSKGIGKTYAGKIPAGRIDYIFHSESLGSHQFKIQEKALSDHYAISCKFFVK
ncbi:MAG: endonuclease/exonuclease/phosphatase family protein [Fluviicola sp.]